MKSKGIVDFIKGYNIGYEKGYKDVLNDLICEISKLDNAEFDDEEYYNAITDVLNVICKYKSKNED